MKKLFFFFFLVLSSLHVKGQYTYPTPPDLFQRLFYIQRTGSPNTVVYDAKFGADGQFHKDQPIDVYWLRFSDYGQRQDLNYLQRTLAYGVSSRMAEVSNEYIFNLVSYGQRKFRLKKNAQGRPVAVMMLNGKEVYLKRVFIELEPTLFGLKPNIHYVEIFGIEAQTGRMAYEKFVP
jgi:hypothetical protein